ncbi:MAG: hypothetical protein HQL52_17785 [Magnetococcales bacterium]|nr:hypothetical protein [Magnetococcales bacterium]
MSFEEAKAQIEKIPESDERQFMSIYQENEKSGMDPIDLVRIQKLIKKKSGITQGELNKVIKMTKENNAEESLTHHDMAEKMTDELTLYSGSKPVSSGGSTWTVSKSGVWEKRNNMVVEVAQLFNGEQRCSRGSEYGLIANHVYALTDNPDYFNQAPIGVACSQFFHRLDENGSFHVESLHANHRQQFALSVEPLNAQMPIMDEFLTQSFSGSEDQIQMLQEVTGATLFGLMPGLQRAVFLKGPGASGKSTFLRILEALVPNKFRGATDPFKWDQEYYVAALAHKRLNIVGELQDDRPLPANAFKKVIGGDELEGRNPTLRPFTFKNTAAHWFNGNHYIFSKERSDAFWRRWVCIEFKNVVPEANRVADFDQKIISKELPQILYWAMLGAQRVVQRGGRIKLSATHYHMIEEWKNKTSSIRDFLHDHNVVRLGGTTKTRRSDLYERYKIWCLSSGYKPISRPGFGRELEQCIDLGINLSKLNGYDVVFGVSLSANPPTHILTVGR